MEPNLVEDSTSLKLVPSLKRIAISLKENANHHEHLLALSIVVMGETGFRVRESRPRIEKSDSIVKLDPDDWRCYPDSSYQLKFKHVSKNISLDCKIVAVPIGDVIIINLCPMNFHDNDVTRTRTVAFPSYKYINPYSSDIAGRFMNLKEFSHRFKDNLTTPMKGEILTSTGIVNPSLLGLPTELKLTILRILGARDIRRMAQTCREFRDLAALPRR